MKVRVMQVQDQDGKPTGEVSYWLWCPGCEEAHRINNTWGFDGNEDCPTFTPSILLHRPANPNAAPGFEEYRTEKVCHSFVRNGEWQFLADSTHKLAGQTVLMVDLPDWLGARYALD